jgi:YbbR domain-containing protein
VYVAVKVIPVLVNEYEFQDSMQNIARNASANGGTIEKIRDAVLKEAEKDELPVNNEDIKVTAKGGNVRINVDYSVTVDLKVYQWTLNFHPAASNDSLI